MFQKHLNQFVEHIQKNGLRNNVKNDVLLSLLVLAICSDVFGSTIANVLFPTSDNGYWNAFFCFQSLSSVLFSSLLIHLYRFYFYRPFKKGLFRWLIESWFAVCCGDLLDNLIGDRYETNIFDFLTLGCIVSSLLNILWIRFVNEKE